MAERPLSSEEILGQLDGCAAESSFPMLDNGYVYLVDSRMSAYRDETRWALIIEIVGFHYRAGLPDGMDVVLYYFGNCLNRPPGTANEDFRCFVGDDPEAFDRATTSIKAEARTIRIRETTVPIPRDPGLLREKGIILKDPDAIQPFELMRALVPEHRGLFLATDDELIQRIPPDLPLFLRLNEWHHPDLAAGEKPSQSETFRMLAQYLETGRPEVYRPTRTPNNHWSNWPESGTL